MNDLIKEGSRIMIDAAKADDIREPVKEFIALVREHDGQGDYMEGWDEGCKAGRQRCIDVVKEVCYKNGWATQDDLIQALEKQ